MKADGEQARWRAGGDHPVLADQGRAFRQQCQPPLKFDAEALGVTARSQDQQMVTGVEFHHRLALAGRVLGIDGGRRMRDALAKQGLAVGQVGWCGAAGAQDQLGAMGKFEGERAGMQVCGQAGWGRQA
jgi:hypothetical protein